MLISNNGFLYWCVMSTEEILLFLLLGIELLSFDIWYITKGELRFVPRYPIEPVILNKEEDSVGFWAFAGIWLVFGLFF
jgi:hypothetical protein